MEATKRGQSGRKGVAMPQGQPEIDESAAIEIARRECERRGWPVIGGVKAWLIDRDEWGVSTGVGFRGCNGSFKIDAHTGEVRMAAFAPM
jgi:hypothetical protein